MWRVQNEGLRPNQVEPFAYVRDLLNQLSGCSPPAVAMLLPDAWLAAQEGISPVLAAVARRTNAALPRS